MKLKKLLIILFIIHSTKSYNFSETIYANELSDSVSQIILSFFVPKTACISITRSADDEKSLIIQSGIINEILFKIKPKIMIRLQGFKHLFETEPRVYNIFFVDSYRAFR